MTIIGDAAHEQVVFCRDPASGLRAIIAIYSTALGPALGGTRFYPYRGEEEALADALALSEAMAYKAACAGLDLGGGKAVILGDPTRDKTEALLRAYGRFVATLGGRYYTACDVGTYVEDMDVVARECRYVTGRSVAHGGAGDSALLTAFGVWQAMRASAQARWGDPSLAGKRVSVSGLGKVGAQLVGHLLEEGATVIGADVDTGTAARALGRHPQLTLVDPAEVTSVAADIFAPCALGGALTAAVAQRLEVQVVCGAANNQLAAPGVAEILAERGVLYAPDFVVNAGGLIQVADEIEGYDAARARSRAAGIFATTRQVFELADAEGLLPSAAAESLARRRMREVGRLRSILLPGG